MPTIKQLELMADKLRIHSLESTSEAGSGHPTSCLSCAEIMSCLFFSILGKNDEFILSKGHAAPILWASLAEAGCFSVEELKNLRKLGSLLEGKQGWHGKALKKDELALALEEIGMADVKLSSKFKFPEKPAHKFFDFKLNEYKTGDMVSTREAYGRALVNLGKTNKDAVVIDGDVKNSTMTEYFFEHFPARAFQSFIAEQNMVGMAVGFSAMGLSPFVATFSAFLSRAHDFIRMAQYSFANIKFAGSHSGISIGQDGPSQMGLEDIPMFLNIPGALVLYPSDAVSAEYLARETAKFKGISYLRTTREKTPVIYKNGEKFPPGGFRVWGGSEKDKALVIAAGITLHEALKAQAILREKDFPIRVIDLYSLRPLDGKALLKEAKECDNKVVVVEDHYCSGIGYVVASALGNIKNLHVNKMPESGKPEELIKKYGIDASAIIKAVKVEAAD